MRTRPPRQLRLAGIGLPAAALAGLVVTTTSGALAGVLAAVGVALAFALAARLETPEERAMAGRVANAAVLAIPGALVVVLSFNAGGFFQVAPALLALGLALILLLRIVLVTDPFEGFGRVLGVAAGAFALFWAWSLLSFTWSDAPVRAFVESDRALLYLLLLVLLGSIGTDRARVAWVVRGLIVGIAVVCTCALITRVLPHVWPVRPNVVNNRLSYPVTYWNTLGLLAAVGCILALHLASSLREPAPVRVGAAALLPLLASTLLFTFSRGALAACAVGLLLYALLGRPRGLLCGVLAAGPPTAIAVITSYHADLLAKPSPTTAAAVSQGRHVALIVALCVVGAAVLRLVLTPLDARLMRFRASARGRTVLRAVAAGAGVAVVVALIATGVPDRIQNDYHRFVNNTAPRGGTQDFRQRLTDPSNNGRIVFWRVAVREFHGSELHGGGAGTFDLAWSSWRPVTYFQAGVVDAHSVYVETLGELGVVGLALLVGGLLTILAGLAARIRGPGRSLYAALLAVVVAWALDAGVDWQWEMPVVTLIVFSIAGIALARPVGVAQRRGLGLRAVAALACVGIGVIPLLVAISQNRLDSSLDAFRQQDCRKAELSAKSSLSALGSRPEPYQVLGYCAIQDGRPGLAVADLGKAVKRDPRNWEYRYSLAVARAAAGQDPRPDLRAAQLLGPFEVLPDNAAQLFDTSNPRLWRSRAPVAPLPDVLVS